MGKKQNPPDAEKIDSIKAEKINSRIEQLFKKQEQKQLKQNEIEKMKIKNYPLKITTRKGGKYFFLNATQKQEKKLLFSKPVPSIYCVKVDGQKLRDKMPQPNSKANLSNPEAKTAISQNLLQKPNQKLEAEMPSEMMPAEHGRAHRHHQGADHEPDHHHHQGAEHGDDHLLHQGAANQDQVAVEPPDLDDAAINAEMIKLQITLESEKTERMKRVEARRKQDEERKVTLESEKRERFEKIEERRLQDEERRSLAEVMRMEEEGANLDEKEWLETVLRMEEGVSTPTPKPSPNLKAKMPTGEESWRKLEEGMRKEEAGTSKQMVSEEANVSESIPAGVKTSTEIASPTPKLVKKKDSAKQAGEHGPQPNEEQEKSSNYTINVTKFGTNQDQEKEMPRRSYGCKIKPTRLSIDQLRKEKRFAQMSSSRNFENQSTGAYKPLPSPGAAKKLTSLISMFETSPSPLKMPRPPPASTTGCWTSTMSSISIPTLLPKKKATTQTDLSRGGAKTD